MLKVNIIGVVLQKKTNILKDLEIIFEKVNEGPTETWIEQNLRVFLFNWRL